MFILFFIFNAQATVWYVNKNASGANDGTTWLDAFTDLQDGIAASSFGDEIWVAKGTYLPTTDNSRTKSFTIKNGTKVFGGFSGTETTSDERDFVLNVTILSGEIGSGAASDNSFHVVYLNNLTNQTHLDGFTITGGYSTEVLSVGGNPGHGGGILSYKSNAVIKNCRIVGNHATVSGGGLYHESSGNLTLENCVFEGNNSGDKGGAMTILTGTNNTITNCYIASNQAGTTGAAIYVPVAANTTITINNSIIAGNSSTNSTIYFTKACTMNFYNSLLVGNYSNTSGVIQTETASSTKNNKIINCTIAHNGSGNESSSSRSVLLNENSEITNSIIYGNAAASQVLAVLPINNSIVQVGSKVYSGSKILTANPQFIAPGNVANAPFDTTGLDYRVTNLSPAIDFGLNAKVFGDEDLDGNTRIQNTTVDLGPYEKTFCNSDLTLTPEAPYTICGGTPITLSVDDASDILWSTGSTDNALTISNQGTYSVAFEDISGCRGNAQINVSSSALPNPSITFTNGKLQTETYADYQWAYNGTEIPEATSNAHTPLEGYGNYEVTVTNDKGCSATKTYCLSPAKLTASGPLSFCEGESVDLTVTDGASQVWSTGDLSTSITVSTSGTYTVTVTNTDAGCSVELQETVTVHPKPQPTINLVGEDLSTQAFASYQWYFNGNEITGATSQTIDQSNGNGQYTVKVIDGNGCEATSAIYNLTNAGIATIAEHALSFYPNPVNGNGILTIDWKGTSNFNNATVYIYDITGAIVQTETLSDATQVTLKNLSSGLYYLALKAENNTTPKVKFIVE